jgi:hypothetical protein
VVAPVPAREVAMERATHSGVDPHGWYVESCRHGRAHILHVQAGC